MKAIKTNPRSSLNVKHKKKENPKVYQNQIPEKQCKNKNLQSSLRKKTYYMQRNKYKNDSRCRFRNYASQKTMNIIKVLKGKKKKKDIKNSNSRRPKLQNYEDECKTKTVRLSEKKQM